MSADLAEWIAPTRTAVLVIDMQVDFATAEGAMGQAGADLSSVPAALAAAERLVQSARAAGAPVVFVGLQTAPWTDSLAWRERTRRRGGDPEQESAVCRIGTPGADFVGPTPLPGEIVVGKARYSGFVGTDLDERLRRLGVDTLVVCGLTTECCVDCTVRDAFQLDYYVFVPADACAAYDPELHTGALRALELNFAMLIEVAAAETAWARRQAEKRRTA